MYYYRQWHAERIGKKHPSSSSWEEWRARETDSELSRRSYPFSTRIFKMRRCSRVCSCISCPPAQFVRISSCIYGALLTRDARARDSGVLDTNSRFAALPQQLARGSDPPVHRPDRLLLGISWRQLGRDELERREGRPVWRRLGRRMRPRLHRRGSLHASMHDLGHGWCCVLSWLCGHRLHQELGAEGGGRHRRMRLLREAWQRAI